MFKVSQDIQLNSNASNQLSNIMPSNNGSSTINETNQIFLTSSSSSPELADVKKVQILNFPKDVVKLNSDVNFIIKKNNIHGSFEVNLETPFGNVNTLPLQVIDSDQLGVHILTVYEGLHKVHINCNSIPLPNSPLIFMCKLNETKLPIFKSDASKIKWNGTGLQNITLNSKNEFTIDASNAGDNIMFVGIYGPQGQCEEVSIRHMGNHVYKIFYQIKDPGMYVIVAKWGEDHIPGSPFNLIA